MRAKAWNNGQHHASGAGYGLKLSPEDRDRAFMREWEIIHLDVPGQGITPIVISESFWSRCSELRSAATGRWLRESGIAPWPKGKPPTLLLEQVDGDAFRVCAPGQLRHGDRE
jgi:hypothetical protein